MKILFFIGGMERGGAERVISILANNYAEKGHSVEIGLLLSNKVKYKLHKDIKIIDFTCSNKSYIKNLPIWILKIRKHISMSKPDCIVSFVGRINMLVLTAGIGLNIPIIVSERNDPKHDGRGNILQWYCNNIYKTAKSIVFQTKYEKSCFSKKLDCKSIVISNPISVSMIENVEKKLEIVTAGRLMPQKNQKLLIDTFSRIHKSFPNISLKIYGEGILRQDLQNLINNYELEKSITLCGNVEDLHKRISGARIFVLTSEFEGQSNALLEAMMLGIPCISTNYSGADEIISNNVNGLLVEKGNIKELESAIILLLTNEELRKVIIKNGIETAKKYKKEIVLKQWEEVINIY
ncbi:glycosyltransferase [Clostridium perfringens]|uniref:glycosyltransferase n=2 Tax=Clostridium perfringens TaxID=1502 RepID=UPI000423356F|nr:glycosyltransferase [Clostridium perfringens]MDB2059900.1 glycosyltransferase [Clostridium perfringens]MDB2062866.1 glycosyltransferase [Clostridium perfringens]MDB2065441.1 glycosyltransferase [Clostridium perfringens]MDK0629692.1 glycosyltransferase [Clostridium perfringens]MDM0800784.1 glycosyltransferase [Clostridium perfringens]